jgi:hypothetical protein
MLPSQLHSMAAPVATRIALHTVLSNRHRTTPPPMAPTVRERRTSKKGAKHNHAPPGLEHNAHHNLCLKAASTSTCSGAGGFRRGT